MTVPSLDFGSMLANSGFNAQGFGAAMGLGADITEKNQAGGHEASGGQRIGEQSFVANQNAQPAQAANANAQQPEKEQSQGFSYGVAEHLGKMADAAEQKLEQVTERALTEDGKGKAAEGPSMLDPEFQKDGAPLLAFVASGVSGMLGKVTQGQDCNMNDVACQPVGAKPQEQSRGAAIG